MQFGIKLFSRTILSALKRIKSCLRSTIDNNRLNPLAILSNESEITSSLKYKKVIEEFSLQKTHRKNII